VQQAWRTTKNSTQKKPVTAREIDGTNAHSAWQIVYPINIQDLKTRSFTSGENAAKCPMETVQPKTSRVFHFYFTKLAFGKGIP
jgi:hypothetical protein